MATAAKTVDFYQKPFKEVMAIIKQKVSGSICRILEFLSASCTFPNEVVFLPPVKKIAELLNISVSTVYRGLKWIEENAVYLKIHVTSQFICAYRTDENSSENFFDFQNCESIPTQKNHFQKFRKNLQNLKNQDPEPPPDKVSEIPQTDQTVHTPQTGGKAEEKINKEQQREVETELTKKSTEQREKISQQNESKKDKNPRFVIYQDIKIPLELIEKLREVGVNTRSERIMSAISNHDISQAYGAAAHIERTSDTVRNPDAVFLHQISKQPIERMGVRVPYETLEHLVKKDKEIEEERKNPEYMQGFSSTLANIKEKLLKNVEKQKNRRQEPSGG